MSNVVTGIPRFAKDKVVQPHPRLRKGTISFRHEITRRRVAHERLESDEKRRAGLLAKSWEATGLNLPYFLHVTVEELDRVLEAGGLCRGISTKDEVLIIMRDPHPAA